MPTITPFLWYDDQAEQAATYYTELFPDSRVDSVARTPTAPRSSSSSRCSASRTAR